MLVVGAGVAAGIMVVDVVVGTVDVVDTVVVVGTSVVAVGTVVVVVGGTVVIILGVFGSSFTCVLDVAVGTYVLLINDPSEADIATVAAVATFDSSVAARSAVSVVDFNSDE